jgi:hypothetical protein
MPAGAAPKAADAKATAQDADWLYTIQRRDTLYDLALAWLEAPRTWQDLQRLNRVADPLRLPPGGKLRMPVAWLKREAAVADVMFVKGTVTLRRGAEPEQPLAVGVQLRSSDVLRTGEQASVSVRFADGSRLLVPPKSEVQLESLLVLGRAALPAVVLRVNREGRGPQLILSRTAPEFIKHLFAMGHGGFPLVGTPDQVAEGILKLHRAGFAGTTLSFVDYVEEFPYFRDTVLPKLEAAGIR